MMDSKVWKLDSASTWRRWRSKCQRLHPPPNRTLSPVIALKTRGPPIKVWACLTSLIMTCERDLASSFWWSLHHLHRRHQDPPVPAHLLGINAHPFRNLFFCVFRMRELPQRKRVAQPVTATLESAESRGLKNVRHGIELRRFPPGLA